MMSDKRQLKTARVNHVGLHYVEAGEGDPIVLVHGSLSDFRSWGLQMRPFSKQYQVVAYSRRYHYPNTWTGDGSDYSVELHAEDLAAFINTLGLGDVHLIGSSLGAYIALIMAVRHPELIRTLVIGEPPIHPLLKHSPEGEALLREFLDNVLEPSKKAFQTGDLELGMKLFIDGVSGAGSFDKLRPSIRAGLLENAPEMKAETTARNYYPRFTKEDARRITAPCLLLTGELSPKMFYHITDILEGWLMHAERDVVPGASHSMHTDNPQAYNETVLKFLAKHRRDA
jgi:pimeloyl-ACP methyl ester carboxylesterase